MRHLRLVKPVWFPRLMKREDKLKREDFKDCVGICMRCGETTEILKWCCYGDIRFKGQRYSPDDFEDIAKEGDSNGKEEIGVEN